MASPIGHALGGITVYALDRKRKFNFGIFIITIVMAGLPDIDFLFGFVVGQPNKYHHGFTHSFVFVILAGILVAAITARKKFKRFVSYSFMFVGSGVSHIILDSLAKDTSPPYGAPIFWPFTEKFYIFPFTVFSDMQRSAESAHFFASLFSVHNMQAVALELLILCPLIILIIVINKKLQPK